ncbi:chitooligosaccharide deacetylase [Delitschia confertaspora ATCC 74209]|uniref:chitin deacetylase n=1 Tax=Delitschia confertaspora ATCC 74209 TaxID=1513339 RepID=A0A9P4MSZ6_9PLEO|nr:chitooligosaccharide deacetylase [Delitschia confertaspora ATCC 74209]
MPRLPLHTLFRLPTKLRRRARRSRIATMFLLLSILCITFSPLYIVYKPPSLLIRYFQHRWPDVLFHVPTSQKIIALTIDDGPSEYTREIMQILQDNDARATWFIIGGQVLEGGKDAMRVLHELVRRGHELGNHAMHDEASRDLSDGELKAQIEWVEEMVRKAYRGADVNALDARPPPKLFRPGSGFFSSRMRELMKSMGYRIVLGGIYPHDPQIPYWRVNARHILSMVRPGGIIICHDRRSWTVPMLRKVIPEIKSRGYRIVTVSKLLEEVGKK